jgi:hypothetical protein
MIRAGEIRKGQCPNSILSRGSRGHTTSTESETKQRQALPFVHAQRNQSLWLPSACRILIRVMHGWPAVMGNYQALAI